MVRLLAALLSALSLSSCDHTSEATQDGGGATVAERVRQRARVAVERAQREKVAVTVGAVGELEPRGRSMLAARVAGTVTGVSFDEGTVAAAGAVLVEIDPERYRLSLDRAKAAESLARASFAASEAQVPAAQAALAASEAGLKNARSSLRRKEDLHKQGFATDQLLDDIQTRVEVAVSDVDRAKADLELARKQVERSQRSVEEAAAARAYAQKELDDCRVQTPFAGQVVAKLVEVGNYCKAGDVVCEIVDVSKLKVRFSVTAAEAARIAVGKEARFSPRVTPNRSLPCTIYFVSPAADPSTRMVECKAWLGNPDARLRAGWFGNVTVAVETMESVVARETGVLPSDRGFVAFVLRDDGDGNYSVGRREVSVGLRGQGRVQILEGIEAGERVVIAGAQGLAEGQKIELVDLEGIPLAGSGGAGAAGTTPSGDAGAGSTTAKRVSPEASAKGFPGGEDERTKADPEAPLEPAGR